MNSREKHGIILLYRKIHSWDDIDVVYNWIWSRMWNAVGCPK